MAIIILILLAYLTTNITCLPSILCEDKLEYSYSEVKEMCVNKCQSKGNKTEAVRIKMFNNKQPFNPIVLAICQKVRLSKKLTETWTFSKVSSPLITDRLYTSEEECLTTWGSKCNYKSCQVVVTPNFGSDFIWAAEIEQNIIGVSVDTILVPSYQSSLGRFMVYKQNEYNLDKSDFIRSDKRTIVWDRKTEDRLNLCPWINGQVIICQKEKQSLWCPQEEISLIKSKLMSPHAGCPNQQIFISNSGHIWEYANQDNMPISVSSPGVNYLLFPSDDEDLERDRISQLNHLLYSRDKNRCLTECMRLDTLTFRTGKLLTIENSIFLTKNDHYTLLCKKVPLCTSDSFQQACVKPKMIRVTCHHEHYWWTGDTLYISTISICDQLSGSSNETIKIHNDLFNLSLDSSYDFTPRIDDYGAAIQSDRIGRSDSDNIPNLKGKMVLHAERPSVSITPTVISLDFFTSIFNSISSMITKIIMFVLLLLFIIMISYYIFSRCSTSGDTHNKGKSDLSAEADIVQLLNLI